MAKAAGNTKKNKRPERDMSFEDIESAINEHVTAATSRMKARSKKPAEDKPAESEKLAQPPKEESVSVTVKNKSERDAPPPSAPKKDEGAVNVAVRRVAPVPVPDPGAEPKNTAEQSSETDRMKARVGKVIEPPSHAEEDSGGEPDGKDSDDGSVPVTVRKEPMKAAEETANVPVASEKKEPAIPATPSSKPAPAESKSVVGEPLAKPVPEVRESNSGVDSQATEQDTVAPKKETLQAPTVFDTKQYHLPIKPSHHHRRQSVPTAVSVLIFLLLFAIGGYVAIKIGFIDLEGFDLPI